MLLCRSACQKEPVYRTFGVALFDQSCSGSDAIFPIKMKSWSQNVDVKDISVSFFLWWKSTNNKKKNYALNKKLEFILSLLFVFYQITQFVSFERLSLMDSGV